MASESISKRFYKGISKVYDALDRMYFTGNGRNPRKVIGEMIQEDSAIILDMCCGTFANGFVVANDKPEATVIGLDRSKPMLRKARQKVVDTGLKNVKLICRDATNTGLKSGCFDYIIIGLVLHECNPELWKSILSEAYRLLKKDGRLIVLDWDRQNSIRGWIKFSPLYICESLVTPKYFKEYYYSDKRLFFSDYGFELERMERCDITFVASFSKTDIEKRKPLTEKTYLLDYDNYNIQRVIRERGWMNLAEFERIKAIYNYVRDEIKFGYNVDDNIPASKVLKDGYGQCNTKGTLFMAFLRACDIPCRVHGFTINKDLQKGAMTGFVYKNAPQNIFHSWVEVQLEGEWYELEAFIIDKKYLNKLQLKNPSCEGAFCGYGVAVTDFKNPIIEFNRNNTYIQSKGINQDFGIYDTPDELLKEHHQDISMLKKLAFRFYGRHVMNLNVMRIRNA